MSHYPYNYRPMAPSPITWATCTACGNWYPTNTADTGCLSGQSVPIATLVTATKCEPCYRRGVTSTTVGSVNRRNG